MIEINIKTFIKDYIKYNTVSIINNDLFNVKIKIERLNWIKSSMEQYFNDNGKTLIKIDFDNNDVCALGNEACNNLKFEDNNECLICNKNWFLNQKTEDVSEKLKNDYIALMNQ